MEFFEDIKNSKYSEAYSLTSKEFQTNTSMSDFKKYITSRSIGNLESVHWNSKSISN
jgi:hypothetical protein